MTAPRIHRPVLPTVVATASAAALLVVLAPTALADEVTVDDPPAVTDAQVQDSIVPLDPSIVPLEPGIVELQVRVAPLESVTTEGAETVVTLASDILFAYGESSIADSARTKIGEVVTDVPQGAAVAVHGHTDAKGDEPFNQTLSEERAQTVADAITAARPDLVLDVQGFGEAQPVAPNESGGEDDPDGRALNRRVEIRYED